MPAENQANDKVYSHKGHRERLRRQYNERGLDGMPDHMILEIILSFAIPRKDVDPIARRLIVSFGSLAGVLEAGREQLESIEGVGPNASVLIRLFTSVNRKYMLEKQQKDAKPKLNSSDVVGEYLKALLYASPIEKVYGLFLDSEMKLLVYRELASGDVASSSISVRNIAEVAIGVRATGVILGHNHPGGQTKPSAADIATTDNISKALSALGITLHDHFIIAGNEYVSLRAGGYFKPNP